MGDAANRVLWLIERIAALNLRVEGHLRDPNVDSATKIHLEYMHARWRDLLLENMELIGRKHALTSDWLELEAANMAQLEKLKALLRRLDCDGPGEDA